MGFLSELLGFLRDHSEPAEWGDVVDHLLASQLPNGTWAGRADRPDMYWTSFALRILYVLDVTEAAVWNRALGALFEGVEGDASLVDRMSALTSLALADQLGHLGFRHRVRLKRAAERLVAALEVLRSPDGGYGRSPNSGKGSTYQTFLAFVLYSELGRALPNEGAAVAFLRGRQRDDGGFSETSVGRRSGANPTAAALAVLRRLSPLEADSIARVKRFLVSLRGPDGGFRANTRVPVSDLLSTFTVANALRELGHDWSADDLGRLEQYVGTLHCKAGFRGAAWDWQVDPEYTFYGIGCFALVRHARTLLS